MQLTEFIVLESVYRKLLTVSRSLKIRLPGSFGTQMIEMTDGLCLCYDGKIKCLYLRECFMVFLHSVFTNLSERKAEFVLQEVLQEDVFGFFCTDNKFTLIIKWCNLSFYYI